MRNYILELFNRIYYNEPVMNFEYLPLSLQNMVKDWENSYRILQGAPEYCSRQVAALLFQTWEFQDDFNA